MLHCTCMCMCVRLSHRHWHHYLFLKTLLVATQLIKLGHCHSNDPASLFINIGCLHTVEPICVFESAMSHHTSVCARAQHLLDITHRDIVSVDIITPIMLLCGDKLHPRMVVRQDVAVPILRAVHSQLSSTFFVACSNGLQALQTPRTMHDFNENEKK